MSCENDESAVREPLATITLISWDKWRLGAKYRLQDHDFWSDAVKIPEEFMRYLDTDRLNDSVLGADRASLVPPVSNIHDGLDMLLSRVLQQAFNKQRSDQICVASLGSGDIFLPFTGDSRMTTDAMATYRGRGKLQVVLPFFSSSFEPLCTYVPAKNDSRWDEEYSLKRTPRGIILAADGGLILTARDELPLWTAMTIPVFAA